MIWINTNQYESCGELVWTCQDYFDNVSMTFSDSWTTLGLYNWKIFLNATDSSLLPTSGQIHTLQIPSDPFRSLQIPWATEVDLSAVSAVARCRWCCPSSPHFPSRAASPRRLHEFSGDIVKWSWDSISWPSLEVSSFVARSAFGIFWHLLASFGIFWRLSDSFGVSFGIFFLSFEFWRFASGWERARHGFFLFQLGQQVHEPGTWALGHFGHFGHLRWSVETLLKAAELELWKSVEVARVRWDLTVSYCIGQSAPLVGILWGTFFFKELGGNPLGHNLEQRGYPQIVLYSHVSSSLSLL